MAFQARSTSQGSRYSGVCELTAQFAWPRQLQPLNPILAEPRPGLKGRACPRPEGPLAHGRGGGAASPRAGAFRPPLAARGSLSLPLLGFCCRAPSLCGPRVNPISRGEAPVTPGLPHPPHPGPLPPSHPGSPANPTARRGRPHVGEAPARAGLPASGRPERASALGPGPPPARHGVGERSTPPGASRRRPGARRGRSISGSGRRSRPPRCAVRSGRRGSERAGAELSGDRGGAGGRLRGGGGSLGRPTLPAGGGSRSGKGEAERGARSWGGWR